MEIIKDLIHNSKKKYWTDGLNWFLMYVIGGLMPIWVTIFFIKILSQPFEIKIFTSNSEFALYSASLLGHCLYIAARDFKSNTFPSRTPVLFIIIFALFISGILYGTVAMINYMKDISLIPGSNFVNREFIVLVSIYLLPLTCILSYFLVVVDNVLSDPDLKRPYKKLVEDFDSTEE